MRSSYAVTWQAPGAPAVSGRLELRPASVRLVGAPNGGPGVILEIPYSELDGVHIARRPEDRIAGRPALVLDGTRGPLRLASVAGHGILVELADRIARLRAA